VDSAIDLSLIDLSDVDGDTELTLVIETGPGQGNLEATPFPGVEISDSGTNRITLVGTVSDLNALLDDPSVITYRGTPDLNGDNVDTISVMLQDSVTGSGELIDLGTAFIDLTPANDAPTDISPDSTTVAENTDGIVALTLETSDIDAGDTFTYSILDGADADSFSIEGDQLIFDPATLDFETQDSYEVTVQTTDSGGESHSETFTVFVTDQNEAPVVMLNNGAVVDEGGEISISNTLLQTTDEDLDSESPIYSITSTPVNGTLLINGEPAVVGSQFTQADIDAGGPVTNVATLAATPVLGSLAPITDDESATTNTR